MKEDFLHYIWKFKLLDATNLKTTTNVPVEVLNFGTFTGNQGPDFFNALLKIDGQIWAGNIEMHLKSSDWYAHQHQNDTNYNNVILHVVWEHDVDVFYPDNKPIPVLVLQQYVAPQLLEKYNTIKQSVSFIPCQNQIHTVPNHIWTFYKERLFFERLEDKATGLQHYITISQSNWEHVLFIALCKGFGLNTNKDAFEQMALRIPFSVFLKVRQNSLELEALFFGMLNLLTENPASAYEAELVKTFTYLKHKYKLTPLSFAPSFYKHRPDNFPTIRISQLAHLFAQHQHLFDAVLSAQSAADYEQVFITKTSPFWETHYTFQSESKHKIKPTTKPFVQLLLINIIIPLLYSYNKNINKDNIEDLMHLMNFLPPENNNTIKNFNILHIKAQSAFDSQVLLQLKNKYCDAFQCLHCAVGKFLIS
ncbi:DUF2851 family protein [Flavobacterium agricola]|uniref:DUF2851 family protein n=1 Tax=Flavobacterium agricola TaxID=2870839 RepID=A0ABY6LWD0_9FLAO|nr:DUF2851 family protein [Flavobacterium agricola]UYW00551.1 DUF2851 family protein [Flavobacterium agricola]